MSSGQKAYSEGRFQGEERRLSPETQDMIFNKLMTKRLIGSRAWGGHKPDSDYDIVMETEEIEKLCDNLEQNGIAVLYLNGSSADPSANRMFNVNNIKFRLNGKLVNIIGYYEEELKDVDIMIESMNALKNTQYGKLMMKDKVLRVNMVELLLKELFLKNYDKRACISDTLTGVPDYDIDEDEIPF